MRFENKSVIITGGGGKIGKAYAMAFAKEGAKVSLPDVASADPVVKAIKDMGGTAISMTCDVSNEKSVKTMVDETVKQFGTIDVLINNAAYFMTVWKGPFWEMTVEEFDNGCQRAWFVALRQGRRPVHAKAEEGKDYQHFVERRIDG
jgi:NAD(P)-dependent dehydrogenase (short-subunit alcohol dehydrogenase family)